MLRRERYRPTLMDLEERAVPGTVLTRPDLSATLGSALASALDATGTDAIAVASYEAQVHSQLGENSVVDVGDQSAASQSPVEHPLDLLALPDVSLLPAGDLNGDHGQTLPPPPANKQIVDLGFLPGSYLQVGNQSSFPFGNDPPTDGWDQATLNAHGKLKGALSHFHVGAASITAAGFHFMAQLEALSKLTGTYDTATGNSSVSATLDVHITSMDAPNFDNDNCKVPATTLNFTTDNGTPFATDPNDPTREIGTVVDNTFAAQAIPHGSCGSVAFVDYADAINTQLGLPSDAGNNVFSLTVSITPAVGP